jgi:hypothetical protein
MCRLKKALHGLKQAPRAWYSRLDRYLQQAGFRKGNVDTNLYIKVTQDSNLLIEVYVDDIIFGSDDDKLSQKFAKDMQNEFEISLLEDLSLFLGLHICERNQGIFISKNNYIKEMLKRFIMEDCKPINNPMQTSCKLSKVLALCKSVWMNRQTTEVTISTNFRAEALACSTQRGLSRVT